MIAVNVAKAKSQESLTNWTKQKWRTKSGKPSAKTGAAEANCGANDLELEAGNYTLAIPDAIGDAVIMNILAATSDNVTVKVVLS